MGFSLLFQNTRELWNEWEMRLLVLLSLFLQLTLATQVRRRKFIFRYWIHVMVWTTYLSADSVATLTLSILSSRLANIQETKGTTNPKSQITAFWAPFLLLHLGGADTITAFVLEDNELWLRQLVRLCIQVGLACFIYFTALSGSTLSMLAVVMILVGLMKYAERILCLYLASKDRLQNSMLVLPNFAPVYPRIMEQHNVKKEEGYWVEIDEVTEVPPLDEFPVDSGQACGEEEAKNLLKAYKLFKIFKLLFLGFIHRFGDLDVSRRMFIDNGMTSSEAFQIVEIELGFMYDRLYTKAPLLNCAWGIIRWVASLSVLGAVLVFFYLQDKKDYAKVDICITFVLICVAILLEIYSLLLAITSNWVSPWRLQRPRRSAISSTMGFLHFFRNQRWSNSVAQFSFFGLSVRKINSIFSKYPWLDKLVEKLMIFSISYKEFNGKIKKWIFSDIKDMVKKLEKDKSENGVASLKLQASEVLKILNRGDLKWSVEGMEFDKSILIWHIATELCYYMDSEEMPDESSEVDMTTPYKMSRLVSRYMLYLTLLHPSMLPTGMGVVRYKDISVDAQMFFKGNLAELSKNRGRFLSDVIEWVRKLFEEDRRFGHTGVRSCNKGHKSRESRDVCELCHILLQGGTDLWEENLHRTKSRSVLFDACHLASQLNNGGLALSRKWELIGKVWVRMLIYAACQCKGYEHCESLSRGGGELLSHIWLLMAHLGIAEAVETFKPRRVYKLIKS